MANYFHLHAPWLVKIRHSDKAEVDFQCDKSGITITGTAGSIPYAIPYTDLDDIRAENFIIADMLIFKLDGGTSIVVHGVKKEARRKFLEQAGPGMTQVQQERERRREATAAEAEPAQNNPDIKITGEANPECPACRTGRMRALQNGRNRICTLSPSCRYIEPQCAHCRQGYVRIDFVKRKIACTAPGCQAFQVKCQGCEPGIMIFRGSGNNRFLGCTQYFHPYNPCNYTIPAAITIPRT